MTMPGFTAEASVGPAIGVYWTRVAFGRAGVAEVLPMQGFPASAELTPAQLIDWPPPLQIRCCQWSPMLGRHVCTSRVQPPGYNCECIRTEDFPFIVCKPQVFAPI
jgi:hypothetical protein